MVQLDRGAEDIDASFEAVLFLVAGSDRAHAMISTLDPEHVRLLEEAGYRRLMTTDVWINQKANRAISSETVERHSRDWLTRWLKGEITWGRPVRGPR